MPVKYVTETYLNTAYALKLSMCVHINVANLNISLLPHPTLFVRHLAKCMRCCNALRS